MTNAVDFIINLKGNIAQQLGDATQHAKQLESNLGGVQSMAGKIASTLGVGFAVFEGISFVKKGVEKFKELEEVTAKVEANLRSTGEKAGVSMEMIEGFSKNLSGKIQASRVDILDMTSQLLTFPAITKDVFQSSMGLVADIAKQTGHGLSETAIMYGKALNDPTDGLQKMMRYGVMFTEQEKAKITTLQASGDLIGAQKFMMQAIATSGYAGVAEAMFNADPIARFNKMMGGAQVAIGEVAVDALKKIMPFLEVFAKLLKTTAVFLKDNADILKIFAFALSTTFLIQKSWNIAMAVAAMITKGFAASSALATFAQISLGHATNMATRSTGLMAAAQWALNAAWAANPVGIVIAGIAALGATIYVAWQKFEKFRQIVLGVWEVIKWFAKTYVEVIVTIAKMWKSVFIDHDLAGVKAGYDKLVDIASNSGKRMGQAWARGQAEGAKSWADDHKYEEDEAIAKKIAKLSELGKISEKALNNSVANLLRKMSGDVKSGLLTEQQKQEIASLLPKKGERNANINLTTDAKGTKEKGTKSVEGKKNIQITVTYNAPLIQDFTISSTNITEGLESLKNKVSEILVGATHDTLLVADH